MSRPTLVFVYNADSGFMNTLLDIGHKILSPSTYDCTLCALTHSTFRMRRDWQNFVDRLGYPAEFLHRDEFVARYGIQPASLPAILLASTSGVKPWIATAEINRCRSLAELEALIGDRIKQLGDAG